MNWKNFAARHHGGGNLLFADGHVAFYSWPEPQVQMSTTYGINDANRPDVICCPWGPINN